MADTTEIDAGEKKKSSKTWVLASVALALLGGGTGYLVSYSGLLPNSGQVQTENDEIPKATTEHEHETGFVVVDPLSISLGQRSGLNLRIRLQLEIKERHRAEVEKVMPRIIDVLNSYLRAIDPDELEEKAVLERLRSQMLRRVQVVTGSEQVRDLLVMEFLVS